MIITIITASFAVAPSAPRVPSTDYDDSQVFYYTSDQETCLRTRLRFNAVPNLPNLVATTLFFFSFYFLFFFELHKDVNCGEGKFEMKELSWKNKRERLKRAGRLLRK